MKRRSFIKRASIGLPALAAGLAGAGGPLSGRDRRRRVYGVPDSVKPRGSLEQNLTRYSLARTDLPPEFWQEVVALGQLAQDVFDKPEVAEAFARDPRAYLAAAGIDDVELDPTAVEVRVAMALGDPTIRAAIRRDDAEAFVRAMEDHGLLRAPEPSQLAQRLREHLGALQAGNRPGPTPEVCTTFAICLALVWVWVGVVQDAVVAVAALALVSVYAYTLIHTQTYGPKKKPDEDALGRLPPFRLAGALGGPEFSQRAVSVFVDQSVERVAAAVESLRIYQESRPMDGDALRSLVRTQMLRQLSGHAVSLPVPRP